MRSALRQFNLADAAQLHALNELTLRSSLIYSIDFRTGRIHASMRDPGMHKGARGFVKTPSRYSWPPSIE
jgi:hypothetical protein